MREGNFEFHSEFGLGWLLLKRDGSSDSLWWSWRNKRNNRVSLWNLNFGAVHGAGFEIYCDYSNSMIRPQKHLCQRSVTPFSQVDVDRTVVRNLITGLESAVKLESNKIFEISDPRGSLFDTSLNIYLQFVVNFITAWNFNFWAQLRTVSSISVVCDNLLFQFFWHCQFPTFEVWNSDLRAWSEIEYDIRSQ